MKHFFSFLRSNPGRVGLLVGLWLLLAGPAGASGAPGGQAAATPSLAEALNPDGSLRASAQGSFDARQFVMHTAPDGRPTFSPAGATGTGDENWQDGFGVPGVNGTVNVVLQVGTLTYVGGSFTAAGNVAANNIAQWDGTSWRSLGTGAANGVTGGYLSTSVYALAVAGTRLYVGGNFSRAAGQSARCVAQWDGSSWSSLSTGVSGNVNALAVSGTNVYVGGDFTQAGSVTANYIAQWNGTSWSSLGTGTANGANNSVLALAVSGSGVYVGGYFTGVGGGSANHVAKWDGTSWYSLGTGTTNGTTGNVYALAVVPSTGAVYIGGSFGRAGGVTVNNLAKWDNTWTGLGTGTAVGVSGGAVRSLVVSGTSVYVGGQFTSAGGAPATYVAQWTGTGWRSLGSGTSDYVSTLALAGTNLLVGGNFGSADGTVADYVAQWNGTSWSSLSSGTTNGANGPIWALTVAGNNVYVGGQFTSVGRVAANNVARWDGTAWSSLGTGAANGVNGTVYAIATMGTSVYVGGTFIMAGGTYSAYIAQWDGTKWGSLGSGILYNYAASVKKLVVAGSTLYVCGYFFTAGGVSVNQLATWNGTTWSSLGSAGVDGVAYTLAVMGTDVYVGGNFNNAGGVSARNIAKWDGAKWSGLGTGANNGVSGPAANSAISALAVSGTNLYVGGSFSLAGGSVAANDVARWDGTNWYSLGTGSANGIGGAVGGGVGSLAMAGTSLYVGGTFTLAGGQPANNIAKWDGTNWYSLGTGLGAPVSNLAPGPGSTLTVVGPFATLGDGSKVSSSFGIYRDSAIPLAGLGTYQEPAVSIYPNPAHTSFAVSIRAVAGAGQVQGELLNPLGQVVRRQAATLPAAGAVLHFETAGLAAGIYTLRLQAGPTTLARRIAIQ